MRIHYVVNFGEGTQETLDADHSFRVGESLPKRFEADKTWQVTQVFHMYAITGSPRLESVVAGTLDVVPI